MILPIYIYGHPILRKETKEIDSDYPHLNQLIENMFATMYQASGVGLAAPQIGHAIRLFVVDAAPFAEDEPELKTFKKVFLNPIVLNTSGDAWSMEEGCLSIPGLTEQVSRKEAVEIEYYDENWNLQCETYEGMAARIILHEYDHLESILFTDLLSPLRKTLIKGKLSNIEKGKFEQNYKFVLKK